MPLVAPILTDEDDGVAMGREAVAGEVDVVANALRGIAIVAHAVDAAWRVAAQPCRVDGSGRVAGSGKGGFDGWSHLVHSDDMNHVMRAPGDGGNAITATINVDDDAILGDGVGTGQEIVGIHCAEIALASLFGRNGLVSVDDFVVATFYKLMGQTHFTDCLRPAP